MIIKRLKNGTIARESCRLASYLFYPSFIIMPPFSLFGSTVIKSCKDVLLDK
jgi:hypothetical protein